MFLPVSLAWIIVLLVINQTLRNWAFVNPDAHEYQTAMELIQSPKKYPDLFKMTCRALHRLVESVKENSTWVFVT